MADLDPASDPDRYVPDADNQPAEPAGEVVDPVGVLAVTSGFAGVLFFGLGLAMVTAVLGAWTGQRARDAGRGLQQAYLALFMAAVDGVVWLALHLAFELPFYIG